MIVCCVESLAERRAHYVSVDTDSLMTLRDVLAALRRKVAASRELRAAGCALAALDTFRAFEDTGGAELRVLDPAGRVYRGAELDAPLGELGLADSQLVSLYSAAQYDRDAAARGAGPQRGA